MSMQKYFKKAGKANEQGATLLEVGETSKALRLFRAALKQLNEGCQEGGVDTLPCSAQIELSDDSDGSLFAAVLSRPICLGEDHYRHALMPLQDQTPHDPTGLYSQAFVFDEEEKGVLTIEKHSFCSAVLIYNTALALHQKAGKEKGKHKAYLKALLFYNEAMNLLKPIANEAESFRVMEEIMKNQADIYYRLNDLSNVQRVWEELASLSREHNLVSIQQKMHMAVSA